MPGPLLEEILVDDIVAAAGASGLIPRPFPPPTLNRVRQRGALRAAVRSLTLPKPAQQLVTSFLAINLSQLVDLPPPAVSRVARFLSHSHRGPATVRLVAPLWYIPLKCSTCHQWLQDSLVCSVCRATD